MPSQGRALALVGAWITVLIAVSAITSTGTAQLPRRRGSLTIQTVGYMTDTARIVVTRNGRDIAKIDPNPGGGVSWGSFHAGITARGTILAGWGCGTNCTVAVLFDRNGRRLASIGHAYSISPDEDLLVAFPAYSIPGVYGDVVELIDLGTGVTLRSYERPSAWNTCRVRWGPDRAVLQRCDRTTRSSVLRLPPE